MMLSIFSVPAPRFAALFGGACFFLIGPLAHGAAGDATGAVAAIPIPSADAALAATPDALFYCGDTAGPGPAGAAVPPSGALPQTLAELVAIGMRSNPDTRVAWAQAEDAALRMGIVRSKYGPILAAEAATIYDHAALPLPKTLNAKGYFKSDAEALVPAITLKWMLYDFGGREAALDQAGAALAGADFGFSAAHRKVAIAITRQYFRLTAVVARRAAAQASLRSARTVEAAAQARQGRGLGTAPETLQARAAAAEAQLRLEEADAAVEDARMTLMEAAGVRPDAPLCVALPDAGAIADSTGGAQRLDGLVERAIATRPEVNAAIAQVKAGEAAIRSARAEYYPTIALAAHAGQNIGRSRADGGEWSNVNQPVYGVGLVFQVPLYDGSIRSSGVQEARSKEEAAEARLDGVKNAVIHEVVKAYTDLRVALRRQQSCAALLAASQDAFDATLGSYRRGLASMPDLTSAAAALARARMGGGEAGAEVATARAVLAFATGDMLDGGR